MLPEAWHRFTSSNIAHAVAEQQRATALREAVDVLLVDSAAQLQAQGSAVDAAFNARLGQYTDALNHGKSELAKVWACLLTTAAHTRQTQAAIAAQEALVRGLEDTLAARQLPLMLASTRLEKRSARPNIELVRDSVHSTLLGEVATLQTTQGDSQPSRAAITRRRATGRTAGCGGSSTAGAGARRGRTARRHRRQDSHRQHWHACAPAARTHATQTTSACCAASSSSTARCSCDGWHCELR